MSGTDNSLEGAGRTRRRAPGFPLIGRTMPAVVLTAVMAVAGFVASWAVIGVSDWLVVALLLLLGAALLPRSPLAAVFSVVLAIALVVTGTPGYSARFVIALAATHLLLVCGSLSAWLPFRSRVQLRILRRPALRYVVIQLIAQALSFTVLSLVAPSAGGSSAVWLGVVGAAAALALAALVLVPALLRPAR